MKSSRSLGGLVISFGALAFVAWIAVAYPGQRSIYGDAPARSAPPADAIHHR
jgi:hypothetical protein